MVTMMHSAPPHQDPATGPSLDPAGEETVSDLVYSGWFKHIEPHRCTVRVGSMRFDVLEPPRTIA